MRNDRYRKYYKNIFIPAINLKAQRISGFFFDLNVCPILSSFTLGPVTYPCNPALSCGCSANPATVTRIVGGEMAGSSTWGWAVSIKLGTSGLCGGSIIASQWILTAAHCVILYVPSQLTVYAGSNTVWSGQTRSVSNIYINSGYYSSTKQNDIALLRLTNPLNMDDPNVKIACIPFVSSSTLLSGEWPPANVDVSS